MHEGLGLFHNSSLTQWREKYCPNILRNPSRIVARATAPCKPLTTHIWRAVVSKTASPRSPTITNAEQSIDILSSFYLSILIALWGEVFPDTSPQGWINDQRMAAHCIESGCISLAQCTSSPTSRFPLAL